MIIMADERLPLLGHQRHHKGFQGETLLGVTILMLLLIVGGAIGAYLLMVDGKFKPC